MTRKTGIVVSGVMLSLLLACQPATLPGVPAGGQGQPAVVSLGAQPGASITISVQPTSTMRTQALPKSAADVNHYKVTLHDDSTNAQVGGTLNIAGAGTTGQFVGVPAGTYYIRADAFADALATQSIVQGAPPIQSVNKVTVNNGAAVYTNPTAIVPAPTSLVVNLPLLDGTVGTGSSSIAIGSRATVLPTADRTGVALLNRASRRAVANPVNPSITYQLSSVQTGASTGNTHEIWAFAADSGTSKASVPRVFGTGANPSGQIIGTVTVTHSAQTLETGGAAMTIPAGHSLVADGNNNVYYYDGTNIRSRTATGNYVTDSVVLTGDTGALTGWAVAYDASGYYSTGANIQKANGPAASNGVLAVTAGNVGILAVDEVKNLYYVETTTNKVRKAVFNGSAYAAPVDVASPGGAPTMLSVNAYGDVYYSTGSNIFKVPLDTDETTYLAPVQVVTAGGITSFAVDRVGNLYFTDNSNMVKFVNAGETTIYTMAGPGTGVGADALSGALPTATNISTAHHVVMSLTGRLLFTSLGTGGVGRFLRYI